MSSKSKVIVVTGANKGIGYEIVLELLRQTTVPLTIYLTARQPSLGESALSSILALSLHTRTGSTVLFHLLDITSPSSVSALAAYLKQTHGEIDVLINNAGIGTPRDKLFGEQFKLCFDCNYFGTARVTDALLPLLSPSSGARISNVSSQALPSSKIASPTLRSTLKSPSLTRAELDALAEQIVTAAQEEGAKEKFEKEGWPTHAYGLSKAFMTALTMVAARENPGLLINPCSPGWVKTDLAPDGPGTAEEGAACPTFVAIGDIGGVTGTYFSKDKEIIDW